MLDTELYLKSALLSFSSVTVYIYSLPCQVHTEVSQNLTLHKIIAMHFRL